MDTRTLSKIAVYMLVAQEMPLESNLNRPDKDYPIIERTRTLLEKSTIAVTERYDFMVVQHPTLTADSYRDIENLFNWFRNRYIIEHTGKGIFKVVCKRFKIRLKQLAKK
jgi:hypothetical protein